MQMVAGGAVEHALVVGADVMSSIIDHRPRDMRVPFGDGAGAVVLSGNWENDRPSSASPHQIDGGGGPALCMPTGGSLLPASHETVDNRMLHVNRDGQAVFKFAVRKTEEFYLRVLRSTASIHRDRSLRLAPGQPPHHSGRRRSSRPARVQGRDQPGALRQHHRGHDPLALADAVADKRIKKGDLVLH